MATGDYRLEFIWISKDEIGKILSQNKTKDDPEIQAIRKGFEKITR